MWNVKAKVIPVIIGATGTILKSLRQYLSNILGKHEIKEIKKKTHTGHCAHTAESANINVQNLLQSLSLFFWGGGGGGRILSIF